MNVALLFFLLLVPLSGFIAWAGDRIGHKTGKKRHSLFGLRPRHTATVITVAAGMCISLVTFGLMWASNATFRDILARGAELIQNNADLKHENDAIQKQVAAKQGEIASLDRQVVDYQQRAERAGKERAQAERDYRAARKNSDRAKADLDAAKKHLTMLQQRLNTAGSELAAARAQVASARTNLGRAKADLGQAEARKNRAEAAARSAQARMVVADSQLADAKGQLSSARRVFKQVTDIQSQNLQHQKDELAAQQDQLSAQQKQLALVEDELGNRRKELDSLQGAVTEFRRNTAALRAHPITYRIGEEVDRVSIPAGTNVWRIEFILDSLLNSSGKKAEARGAQRSSRTQRAVALAPPLLPPASEPGSGILPPSATMVAQAAAGDAADSGQNMDTAAPASASPAPAARYVPLITESDLIRAAAEAIRRDNRDVVVIAVASTNAVAGEPVPVDIRTFHNPVVLNSGASVGEVTVDGTATRQEIVDALYSFLHRDVRSRLLQAGIIPPLGGAESSDGSIVTLSGDAWLKILDDVRKAGSRARVMVKADRTTRAADPVSLRFEVKRGWDSQDVPTTRGSGDGTGGVTHSGGSSSGSSGDGMALH